VRFACHCRADPLNLRSISSILPPHLARTSAAGAGMQGKGRAGVLACGHCGRPTGRGGVNSGGKSAEGRVNPFGQVLEIPWWTGFLAIPGILLSFPCKRSIPILPVMARAITGLDWSWYDQAGRITSIRDCGSSGSSALISAGGSGATWRRRDGSTVRPPENSSRKPAKRLFAQVPELGCCLAGGTPVPHRRAVRLACATWTTSCLR